MKFTFLKVLVIGAAALSLLSGCANPSQPASVVAAPTYGDAAGAPSSAVAIAGAVIRPVSMDVTAIKAAASMSVTAGGHAYTGAALWPLLQSAGIRGVKAKNPTVSMYLVATGSDGYRVVVSLAEIDPDFGAKPAIVAYAMDGAPLGRSGALRLIMPSDVKMARSVSNLTRIELVTTGDSSTR